MTDRQQAPFERIGIIGMGLIGGSIALAARHAWPSVRITGTPSRSGTLPPGMLDHTESDIVALAAASDLVILGVPVTAMPAMMATIARSGTTAVVTDVGSTKRGVMAAARDAGLRAFIGGHPMAGGERPGAFEARTDLFVGKPWLLVEGSAAADQAARLEAFVRAFGAVSRWMPADVHDRTVAYVSHLPQVVAAALMNAADRAVADTGPHVAGNAFAEMTRLASSPAEMWQGICAENADFVAEALRLFLAQLPEGQGLVDGSWVGKALPRSGAARDRWRAIRHTEPGRS
ncbi:MAG: prephenate dehydrogenase/arogenate dehydrogenase family protein [Acidobacteria bacterium]|nr:prephenate dehydrogenase/arogenate dehydrogenase family protein [Acidobacteriota bacterium]